MTTTAPTTLCCGDCRAPLVRSSPSPFVQVLRCEQPARLARRCYGCGGGHDVQPHADLLHVLAAAAAPGAGRGERRITRMATQKALRPEQIRERDVLTIRQACIYADVSPWTIRRWEQRGLRVARHGAIVRIYRSDLDAWLRDGAPVVSSGPAPAPQE